MKDEIKELITKIDTTANTVKELKTSSRHLAATYDYLTFAKAWLGKTLGELGEPTPYQNDGKRVSVEDIEPVANHTESIFSLTGSLISDVDNLRQYIEELSKTVFELTETNKNTLTQKANIYSANCFSDLTRAKMWLGFELGRIRDMKSNNGPVTVGSQKA